MAKPATKKKSVEMNSFLYWCKKKMTLADIEQFTKGGEDAVASKLAAVEKAAPKADDAQKWFDRADQFAKKNPDEHLLIAVRFFEVADRFKGSDTARKAMDYSLKEMLQEKSGTVKTVVQPTPIKPAETVANPVEMRPVPGADDIKMAEKLIKDLLKSDYAKTDAPSRLALVAKLLQQAEENKNDAAVVYVCLHESRDLAVLVGDVTKAAEVQIQLSDSFKSDFAAILLDLKKFELSAKSAEPATALAALFAFEAERALAAADYDQAVRLYSRAEDLLPLAKDTALKARLKTEIPRVQAIKRDSVAVLAAQKTLAAKPDDAEANLTAGKFALLLGRVAKSMELLAKSKDVVLSGLAKHELTRPQEATEQTLLAEEWFDRAEKEGSTYLKTAMQQRASFWYASALPGLTGLPKLKVEGRMKALPQSVATTETPKVPAQGTWMVIFRSDDPANWDKKVKTATDFAVEIASVPDDIKFIKITKVDNSDFVIVPIGKEFLRKDGASGDGRFGWWNSSNLEEGAFHLGIWSKAMPIAVANKIAIRALWYASCGWGFGHKTGVNGGQWYAWNGKEIHKTVFEIAVTRSELTTAEQQGLKGKDEKLSEPAQWWVGRWELEDRSAIIINKNHSALIFGKGSADAQGEWDVSDEKQYIIQRSGSVRELDIYKRKDENSILDDKRRVWKRALNGGDKRSPGT